MSMDLGSILFGLAMLVVGYLLGLSAGGLAQQRTPWKPDATITDADIEARDPCRAPDRGDQALSAAYGGGAKEAKQAVEAMADRMPGAR